MNYVIHKSDGDITLDIRRPNENDFDAYCKFIQQIATETCFTFHYVGEPEINRARQLELWSAPHRYTVAAFDGDVMVGYTCLYATNPGHPYLGHNGGSHTYILQKYTGAGLGTRFYELHAAHVKDLGIKRISVNVHADNVANLALLHKQGFITESVARGRYFVNGEYVDCCNLVKWYE